MTKPSDDECIALALLHGCEFRETLAWSDGTRWFYGNSGSVGHPFNKYIHKKLGRYSTKSISEMARLYCEHFKLIGDEDEHSPQLRPGHAA